MRIRTAVLLILSLTVVACGDGGAESTTTEATTPSTTTTSTSAAPTPTTTAATETTAPAEGATAVDLPDELTGGTYLVGTEIRSGSWEPDECGCPWAIIAADGTETLGTSEDARVDAADHAVRLGSCTWTFAG